MTEHLTPELLVDYVHHELSPADDARAFAHLSACATCTAGLEAERSLVDALRAAAERESVELPSLVKAGIWQRVRTETSVEPWWQRLLRPSLALPIAAAVVIGAVVTVPTIRSAANPRIGVSYYLQQHASSRAHSLTDQAPQPSVLLEESDAQPSASFVSFAQMAGAPDSGNH